ncbi:MAG: alpha/beta fold hydrolase [Candidatus Komeilibacteria bacterium]
MNPQPIIFNTPDKYQLNGLWYTKASAKQAIIFVHGLGSSIINDFDQNIIAPLANNKTAVLLFNNRGHDLISKVRRPTKYKNRKKEPLKLGGSAMEHFTDCVYDIAAAINFVRRQGIQNIVLIGHSTGCQKIAYYLAQGNKQAKIKSAILLCPMSDYAALHKHLDNKTLQIITKMAKKMIRDGRGEDLLPKKYTPYISSAQRWLSLYTPFSDEEIFTYSQAQHTPTIYQSLKLPLYIILAGQDEHRSIPIKKIASWFNKQQCSNDYKMDIIAHADHGFRGKYKIVKDKLQSYLAEKG